MSFPAIKADSLSCGYKEGFRISDISMTVGKGEIAGIIGPNGSGKTTLLKAFTGLLRAEKGDVEIFGRSVSKMTLREKAEKIAVVSQEKFHPFSMNVLDYVMLGRTPRRKRLSFGDSPDDIRIANEMLEVTGTGKFKDRDIQELSGGERQLVHIARALAQETEMLILDEPMNHLDLRRQHDVLNLISGLTSKKGLSVIMVIHDLNLASFFCTKLHLMKEGRLFKAGAPSEVICPSAISEVFGVRAAVSLKNEFSRPYLLPFIG